MRDMVTRFFSLISQEHPKASGDRNKQDVRVATYALFLEMAHIDDAFTKGRDGAHPFHSQSEIPVVSPMSTPTICFWERERSARRSIPRHMT